MQNTDTLTPRDTAYDMADVPAFTLVNRTGALAYNVGRFVLDIVETFGKALQAEADGLVWVVPCEVQADTPADGFVLQDGTPCTMPRGAGQTAWRKRRAAGEIREAAYVYVTEGVDTDAVRASMHASLVLQRLAGRLMRESRITGRDVTRELQTIEGEIRFHVAEIMAQDPTFADVARVSYPAYITDRVERMSTDGAGWHWGDGSRYESSLEAHAVHKG